MSEMDDDEYEYTRELHTHDIRNKNLMDCNARELRIRCSFDEQYINQLEKEFSNLKRQFENLKSRLKADRDIDEEFK